ncbi:MAG: glycoside hydrolase family 9 protein, partial [Balneolales bacterium]|nr:glycoside hydrolase family 9 protein [Balneolales bacterium]
MRLLCFAFVIVGLSTNIYAQSVNNLPKLNQLGFYINSDKLAVAPASEFGSFYIKDAESGAIVYQGELEDAGYYQLSDEHVEIADFSSFKRQGKFILGIDGGGESFPFEIKNKLYDELSSALIKALYYNRVSTELEPEYAGIWARPAGQPDDNVIIHGSAASPGRLAGSSISSPGGWYDAGDFNKYVVPISSSIHHILFAYESFPEFYSNRELNIPESGDEVPDILDETLYALRWLLTMQDPFDGGVYNKLTYANFQATVMPNVPTAPRYVVQKGTAATLDFAAVMAQSARVYEPFYPDFADSALAAAEYAYSWAQANPNMSYNQSEMNANYDPDVNTGAYGDSDFSDEWFWASSELYITTQNEDFYPANGWQNTQNSGWSNVRALGLFSLIRHRVSLTSSGLADTLDMKNELFEAFEPYVSDGENSAYRSPFGIAASQFNWGSNGGAGNLGMGILMAYELTNDPKYYHAAIDIMDYLLGRNAVAYSYVTGFGEQSPMHIHHRQSEADGILEPIPGWVAGGANPNNQSQDCGTNAYNSTLPALSYLDSYCSYSTNEITTYWNSPFIYMTAAIESFTEDGISDLESPLKFIAPEKDLFYDSGMVLPISWEATGISSVDLFYKIYSDETFIEIGTGLDASLSEYAGFVIPDLPGDSLLLKIQDSSNPEEFAYSSIVHIRPPKSVEDIEVSTVLNLGFIPGILV